LDWLSIIILSVGLAMDALAVSVCSSIALKEIRIKDAMKIAFFFGLFQAGMPLIGWLAGMSFRGFIRDLDHWIAFGLLLAIGGKMIYESSQSGCETSKSNPLKMRVLLGLSVATSIDALAAGVGFGVLQLNIWAVITVIGAITFILSFNGARLGNSLGCRFGRRAELLGGLILIGIGIKIVVEHIANGI